MLENNSPKFTLVTQEVFPNFFPCVYILCKYTCAYFRNIDINTYSAHVYDYTLNSGHSGIKLPRYLYIHIRTTCLLYIVYSYYTTQKKVLYHQIFTKIYKYYYFLSITNLNFKFDTALEDSIQYLTQQ